MIETVKMKFNQTRRLSVNDVYKRLAQVLDRIPNGYPATESGVELKILAKLFTPEEAELACHMTNEPEPPGTIAERIGWEERKTYLLLKGMTKKGLLEIERGERGFDFMLIPFVVGFYENQNQTIDEEFAQLFEQYYQEGLHKMMSVSPSVHRVIPIEQTVPVGVEVMPYERASYYLDQANSWGVLRCICRVQKQLVGEGCEHSLDNCLAFSKKTGAFDRVTYIKAISKEEALEILAKADEEGLVHSTNNVQDGVNYICNCCSCSCGILRGVSEFGHLNAMSRSDFNAVVDGTLCSGCEACLDRCHFSALEMQDDICTVNLERCYGCGLCVTTCPTEAITLVQKPQSQVEPPPQTEEDWRIVRTEARKTADL
jgi:Fe-S-cluster-containing hydrogenase component 2